MIKDHMDFLWDLDSINDPAIQEKGIQCAVEMVMSGHLSAKDLIHPTNEKQYWINLALALMRLPQEYLLGYEAALFDAIQDINWPGTDLLITVLCQQPLSQILPAYKQASALAKLTLDDPWAFSLYILGEKINSNHEVDDVLADIGPWLKQIEAL